MHHVASCCTLATAKFILTPCIFPVDTQGMRPYTLDINQGDADMTDLDILAAHGFTPAQAARAVSKPVAKRSAKEQALVAALVKAA